VEDPRGPFLTTLPQFVIARSELKDMANRLREARSTVEVEETDN
jgi:hypothetical protein